MKGRDRIIWVNEKNTSTWRYRTTNLKNCWMHLRLVFTCCHFNDLEKNLSEVQGKVASIFAEQHNESYSQRLTTLNEIFTWRHSIPSFPAVLLGHSEAGSRKQTTHVWSWFTTRGAWGESTFSRTVKPWYNEGLRDWQNLFAVSRLRYIEVLFHIFYYYWGQENCSSYRQLRYIEVRYIEVPL